jgi:tetratricopeptide (TPR) repeat protein
LHAAALRANNNLGVVYESSDRYDESIGLTERGLELARRAGNRVWEEAFIGGAISGLVLLGRWDEAVAAASQIDLDRPDSALLLTHLATVYCERGETETARQLLANPVLRTSEDLQAISSLALAEAAVLRTEGKPREGLASAEAALAARAELGITFLNVKLALVEALEAAFSLGDTDRVRELLDEIEALRPGERPPLLEAHAHRFRAKLSRHEAEFRAAANLFRELFLVFWLAVTLLEHAELLAEQGRPSEAEPLLAEAREVFERLGAKPWLERLEAVEPRVTISA